MNFIEFFFTNKAVASADPLWLILLVISWGVILLLLSIWGKRIWTKERHQALHKTFKKSSTWLKLFGIMALVLLWFRLESLRVFSMWFWWVLYGVGFIWVLIRTVKFYVPLKRRIERAK